MTKTTYIAEQTAERTRISLGNMGCADGLDEDLIDFVDSLGDRQYERVTLVRNNIGDVACTFLEVEPQVEPEHLDEIALFVSNTVFGRDREMIVTPSQVTVMVY